MSPTAENLLHAALALTEEDRRQVVEGLLSSFRQAGQPDIDEAWRETVRKRSADVVSSQVTPIPWEEVERQGRQNAHG